VKLPKMFSANNAESVGLNILINTRESGVIIEKDENTKDSY